MALTETGFSRRTYDEILTDKIAKAKELFGEDIETSELTPLGKFIRINAYDQALIEEEAEKIYYSIFPNTATGTSLDRLCVFAGISRNPATAAKYVVELRGTANVTIGAGFLVGTESGIQYAIIGTAVIGDDGTIEIEDGNVTFDENGMVLAAVQCMGSGSADEWDGSGDMGNVVADEICKIINPSADVTSVIGMQVITKGDEVESDYSLRKRFAIARDGLGSGTEASIIAAIMRVATVESVGIITDEDAHSFECFVAGGEDYHKEIAEAIFDKKPIGIKTTGQVSYDVKDVSGGIYTVRFSHTGEIRVYVKVAIKTNTLYGVNGESEIQSNISTYIDGLEIGNGVVLSALYGKVHSVTGVTEVTSLLLSTDGVTWETTNIEPQRFEKCSCASVTVEVI